MASQPNPIHHPTSPYYDCGNASDPWLYFLSLGISEATSPGRSRPRPKGMGLTINDIIARLQLADRLFPQSPCPRARLLTMNMNHDATTLYSCQHVDDGAGFLGSKSRSWTRTTPRLRSSVIRHQVGWGPTIPPTIRIGRSRWPVCGPWLLNHAIIAFI